MEYSDKTTPSTNKEYTESGVIHHKNQTKTSNQPLNKATLSAMKKMAL